MAEAGAAESQLGIFLSLCSLGASLCSLCVGYVGLHTWHPQGNVTAYMVAQGSRKNVQGKRAKMKFYDFILQVTFCRPYSVG